MKDKSFHDEFTQKPGNIKLLKQEGLILAVQCKMAEYDFAKKLRSEFIIKTLEGKRDMVLRALARFMWLHWALKMVLWPLRSYMKRKGAV